MGGLAGLAGVINAATAGRTMHGLTASEDLEDVEGEDYSTPAPTMSMAEALAHTVGQRRKQPTTLA